MTISTKPEDIDSPETILHYMDSYPASGQNRAAAKLIRELLAAVPLVAARDDKLVEMTQQEFDDFEDWWLTIPVHEETIIDMKHVRMAWLAGRSSLAGQVAPQAIEGTPFGWLVTFNGCNPQFVIDRTFVEDVAERGVKIKADIALFDHPTSKATEKSALSEIQDQLTRMLHTAAVLTDAELVTGYQIKTGALHSILGTMQGAGFPVEVPLPQNTVATSKADTGEAIRNAALDRCAKGFEVCFAPRQKLEVKYVIESILACKSQEVPASASPSTDAKDAERLLQEIMACTRSDPARGKSNAGKWTTINARTELIERIDAAIAAMQGEKA